jgi:hypothetical protein
LTGKPNQFFYQARDAELATQVDPHEMRAGSDVHRRYLFGVLAELDRLLPGADLKFWVTWERDKFDERFRDSVAVLYDDDQLQKPLWAPAVSVIFKTVGLGPEPLRHTAALPADIAWRMALRDARNAVLEVWRFARGPRLKGQRAPTFQIPLGASALVDVADVPFSQRPTDVFFAGSVGESERFTIRPKNVARRQMEAAVEAARRALPDLTVDYLTFEQFGIHTSLDARILRTEDYVRRLTASKYALCPRGNVEETYRVFEAARAGCVIISEPLPPRWYFASAPYVSVRRWSELPSVLRDLREDERAGGELADATLAWWRDRIAEPKVAEFMRERIPAHMWPSRSRDDQIVGREVVHGP